jgi:ABC-type glycerol-3-phosphate transport system substrate-binding protein
MVFDSKEKVHMKRSVRRLAFALSLLVSVVVLPGHTLASASHHRTVAAAGDDANTLTIMTCCGMWGGFNNPNYKAGGVIPFYNFYHTLWKKRFPHLKIKEIDVPSYADLISKTILSVNAGDPPDLIGTQGQLGLLVARHAVENLDSFYARDHITPSYFLPALADWARLNGHWYAMPAGSSPSVGEMLYIPKFVKAAGWDPNKIPVTWDGLWAFTQKVTKWDSKGNLVRIGFPLQVPWMTDAINLFCGYFADYDTATHRFHANSPCIKNYFRYELRLLKFYGGVAKYTRFISGDPDIWGGYTPKAYFPSGKTLLNISGYWTGQQLDLYFNVSWRMAQAPTPHGTPAELRACDVGAQQIEIPTGAKHAQLAWDFTRFTLWDYGYVQGAAGDGYTVPAQAEKWAQVVVNSDARSRARNHFPGNPMAEAIKVAIRDGQLGRTYDPTDPATPYYVDIMNRAWQQMEYGRASVDQALDEAQRLIDARQRALFAQFGMW